MSHSCALCDTFVSDQKISENGKYFCCLGCLAVFNILKSCERLENSKNHPLFQQALKLGLISNPTLLEEIKKEKKTKSAELKKWHFEIRNMWCPSCSSLIELLLLKMEGVLHCHVDYVTDLAVIEYEPMRISKEQIYAAVASMGYEAGEFADSEIKNTNKDLNKRFLVAIFCTLNVMMFAYPLYATYFSFDNGNYGSLFAYLSLIFSMPVVIYSARPIFRKSYLGVKTGLIGMEGLVTIGVLTAFLLSLYELYQGSTFVYFDSMCTIVAFVLLGKMIESKAKLSMKGTLLKLCRSLPKKGRKRFSNGEERFTPIKEISVGDDLIVLTGEKVVLDGKIVEGEGILDESLMSGESLPIHKKKGDRLLAGTVVQQGYFVYQTETKLEETFLQGIVSTIQGDVGHKFIHEKKIDRIATFFTLFVFFIAALTCITSLLYFSLSLEEASLRSIAVLLISCPCAIGIAAPLAESNLIQALANLGIIVRNRAVLSLLGKETVYIFDKTGTITEGKFKILKGLETLSPNQRQALKSLASYSVHPISLALSAHLLETKILATNIQEIPGKGIKGKVGENYYWLGSPEFLEEEGICFPKKSQSRLTTVYFAENGKPISEIVLGDSLRKEAENLLNLLKNKRTVLLSGDSQEVVNRIGKELGFSEMFGKMSPLHKRAYIENLKTQGEIVFMLGDGINDAPSITAAHIGASVLSASDLSMQVSDLLFSTEKLSVAFHLTQMGKKGRKIIAQNFFWAFFYNCIGIILAALGFLSPVFAAFAMVISSLIVLFNSKRI